MTFDEWITEQPAGISACDSFTFGRKVWEAATVKESLMVQVTEVLQAQEPESCPYCDGSGDVHSRDGEWRGECNCGAAQYNMIDRLLRNTFDDEDYAVYSAALDVVAAPQPPASHYCNKCGYHGQSMDHKRPGTDTPCGYFACETKETVTRFFNTNATLEAHVSMLQAKVAEQSEEFTAFHNRAHDHSEKQSALINDLTETRDALWETQRALCNQVYERDMLIERCRDALSMPCDHWNKRQSLIVNDVLEALAAHKKGGSE